MPTSSIAIVNKSCLIFFIFIRLKVIVYMPAIA